MIFMECEACRVKPGAPTLCLSCQHNRTLFTRLLAALEPFRHMRVRRDEKYAEADCEFIDLIDGAQCVVGYARNGELANHFDEIFERVRSVLK